MISVFKETVVFFNPFESAADSLPDPKVFGRRFLFTAQQTTPSSMESRDSQPMKGLGNALRVDIDRTIVDR